MIDGRSLVFCLNLIFLFDSNLRNYRLLDIHSCVYIDGCFLSFKVFLPPIHKTGVLDYFFIDYSVGFVGSVSQMFQILQTNDPLLLVDDMYQMFVGQWVE